MVDSQHSSSALGPCQTWLQLLTAEMRPQENRSYSNAIIPIMTAQMDVYTESEARDWDSGSQVTAKDN